MNPRVNKAIANDDFTLTLSFANGEQRVYDLKPLLGHGVFAQLKDLSIFKQVKVLYGTTVWPGDIDICPDTLYEDGVALKVTLPPKLDPCRIRVLL